MALTFLSSPAAAKNQRPALRCIDNGDRSSRSVALTFDACRISEKTVLDRKILDVLSRYNVPATIFMTGRWMEAHTEETKELAVNPLIELATHSFTHPDMRRLDGQRLRDEITSANELLKKLTGKESRLFRFPYGYYNNNAVETVRNLGYLPIGWDVVSGDPDPNIAPRQMANHVLRNTRPGSIIIMHINGKGRSTAAALPTIIEELRNNGFTFVTVSELLRRGNSEEAREH